MAIPLSGSLGLRSSIALEVFGNNTGSDISLRAMADAAGFSTPDEMGEFYGYSSVVTVTLDGGQSRTGTPGASGFGSMTFDVTAPSGRGYTSTDRANATLTGLPSAFVASFATTGTSTGRWSITTTDGNFPDDDYALLTANFSISNPSTPIYTFTANWQGYQGSPSATTSTTAFQGCGASLNRSTSTGIGCVFFQPAAANAPSPFIANATGVGGINASTNVSISALNSNCSTNVSYTHSPGYQTDAQPPSAVIQHPPWNFGTGCAVGDPTTFTQIYYNPGQTCIDNRVRAHVCISLNGGSTNCQWYSFNNARIDNQSGINRFYQPGNIWPNPEEGQYCVFVNTNHPNYSTIAQSAVTCYGGGPQ